eukprot:m.123084 g.123084  ORF g.123084 m.123084 type:complete len:275 (-) comp28960_c0_seq1:102-926(-)
MGEILVRWGVPVAFGINCLTTLGMGMKGVVRDAVESVAGHNFGTNKEVSDENPTLVTPAGAAFAIWAPIFALETASVVYQGVYAESLMPLQRAAPYFVGGCLLQALWGVAFANRQIHLSTCLIGGLTYCISMTHAHMEPLSNTFLWRDYILGVFPYALHTQWLICATTISCNMSAAKVVSPDMAVLLAQASQLATVVLGVSMSARYEDSTFAVVSAWALHWISVGLRDENSAVANRFPKATRETLASRALLLSRGLLGYSVLYSSSLVHGLSRL